MSVTGNWAFEVKELGRTGVLTLRDERDGTLTGALHVDGDPGPAERIRNGRISNGSISFDTVGGGASHWVGRNGALQGNEFINGTVLHGGFEGHFACTRRR